MQAYGYSVNLVGGATRDFLLSSTISNDLDFEIKSEKFLLDDDWLSDLEKLFSTINSDFGLSFKSVGFGVFTCPFGDFDLEFSSPRVECFDNNQVGHKNFEVSYISNLSIQRAYARRDFTINAMALHFDFVKNESAITLLDPYNGLEDLNKAIIRNINDDFFKDPVRFLRMIRFKLRFDFSFSKDMLEGLSSFNLTDLTVYYFKKEYSKSLNLDFFKYFFMLISTYNIKVTNDILKLKFLASANTGLLTRELDEAMISLRSDIDLVYKINACEILGLKKKVVKKFHRLFEKIQLENEKRKLDLKSVLLFEELELHGMESILNLELLTFFNNFTEYKLLNSSRPNFSTKEEVDTHRNQLLLRLDRKICPK